MSSGRAFNLTLLLQLVLSTAAHAIVADHLTCYKIKDPQKRAKYTADLAALVPEPGCKITVPAAIACVPTTKNNVTPPPPGGGGTGTPSSFFCYKVKCPKAVLPTLGGTDQFGSRTVTPKTAQLLCAPLRPGNTTTTTSSTTTTTLRFADNGDGTVTDNQTCLQWEKKDHNCPGLHCVTDTYTWSNTSPLPDGTAFTSFLDTLNGGATGVGNCVSAGISVTGGFNGHCDWRLPTFVELQTIVDVTPACAGFGSACIDPIFGPTAGVTNTEPPYWSSITADSDPNVAWFVSFFDGSQGADMKFSNFAVRAVRGGP